jgi:quinol monooxygenase YgiN
MKSFFCTFLIVAVYLGVTKAMASQNQKPLILIATVKVLAGTEKAFKAAAVQILEATRAEEGSISYIFNQSVQDPTEFSTVEVWRSQADIDAHMIAPHVQKFFSTVGAMFVSGYPILKTYQSFDR